jgi:hypothetical protein
MLKCVEICGIKSFSKQETRQIHTFLAGSKKSRPEQEDTERLHYSICGRKETPAA